MNATCKINGRILAQLGDGTSLPCPYCGSIIDRLDTMVTELDDVTDFICPVCDGDIIVQVIGVERKYKFYLPPEPEEEPEEIRTTGTDSVQPLSNLWLGVSAENQTTFDVRTLDLIATPAAKRLVSLEPLLEKIDISQYVSRLDWVILGGESGPGARPCHPDWVRSIRDQCNDSGTPFFFKQWGAWEIACPANGHFDSNMERNKAIWLDIDGTTSKPSSHGLSKNAYAMIRVGKKKSGRILDGRTWDEFPEVKS